MLIDDFRLGQASRKGWRMLVAGERDVGEEFAVFLRAHRVLVSHSQHKMYFTYVGSPVFAVARPPADQDAKSGE